MKKKTAVFLLVILMCLLVSCTNDSQGDDLPENRSSDDANVMPPLSPPTPDVTPPEAVPAPEVPEEVPGEAPDNQPLSPPEAVPSPAPRESQATGDFVHITATELTANIRIGWNLGNTLDAHDGNYGFSWLGGGLYENTTVAEMEAAWVGSVATRENIDAIHAAGFNAIRIPVTWFKATDNELNIRQDWMERVQEIVDYAVDNNMCIILNTHHDEYLIRLLDRYMEDSKHALVRLWEQIAYVFQDYNEKLVFEGLNEPRTIGSSAEWSGGTAEERHNLNILNQLFVDTIRRSGGNNPYRVLMVPTYAASAADVAQRALVIPTDSVEDRIIVSLHIYAPWEFALRTGPVGTVDTWDASNPRDTRPITDPLDLAYELFVSQGIPVIIGEMGALNRDNIDARAEWAEFFVSQAASRGMPSIWWDNGTAGVTMEHEWGWEETFGLLDRRSNQFVHPEIIDALMRATE